MWWLKSCWSIVFHSWVSCSMMMASLAVCLEMFSMWSSTLRMLLWPVFHVAIMISIDGAGVVMEVAVLWSSLFFCWLNRKLQCMLEAQAQGTRSGITYILTCIRLRGRRRSHNVQAHMNYLNSRGEAAIRSPCSMLARGMLAP